MKDGLNIGAIHTLSFPISKEKTVPHLYPEAIEFREMPEVFATGYMVGLMELCCMQALAPMLEEGEGSLGILINVTHVAPTPIDATVTVSATVSAIEGRKVTWQVTAHDDLELIGEGLIGRAVVQWSRFNERIAQKRQKITNHQDSL